MQRLPGLLSGIALICFIATPGYTLKSNVTAASAHLAVIEDKFGKKTCRDGYVHGIDYFIVNGFIDIIGYTPPKIPAWIVIYYLQTTGRFPTWYPITNIDIWVEPCTGIQQVPLDTCKCKYENAGHIRVRCNITADSKYSYAPFRLSFRAKSNPYATGSHDSQAWKMTKVYGDINCTSKRRASTNGGTSPLGGNNGMPGLIFLVTALVCIVASMVSNGE
ncbi:unnamed protein product [Lymnaea stagnalis]|uniref:Uncharacterized protein n=1 Tax=Lymnaea stagnalis TaxID=6523 RepID=A0AAV2HGQ5_LYMST